MNLTTTQKAALKLLDYELGQTVSGVPAIFEAPKIKDISRFAAAKYERGYWLVNRVNLSQKERDQLMSILNGTD